MNPEENNNKENQREQDQSSLSRHVTDQARGKIEQTGKQAASKVGKRLVKQVGKKAVVAAGQALVESAPAWGIPALIFVIIIIVAVIIFGGNQDTVNNIDLATCEGISTSSLDATPTRPTTLTAVNCEGIPTPLTYTWTSSDTGGTLSNPIGESTTYTPSSATIKNVTITLAICSSMNISNCSRFTIAINGSTLSSCTLDYTQYPAECLKQVFNVVVDNDSNKSHLITIYKIYASTNSETFRELLTKGGRVLHLDVPYCTSDCISLTSTDRIKLNGFFSLGLSYKSQRYLLIHESGHVIQNRNPQLGNSFSNTLFASQDGTACYQYDSSSCSSSKTNRQFVKSYSLRYYCGGKCYAITAQHEAFAEAISNYMFASRDTGGWRCSISIPDVKSQCSNTNNWIKNHIYGGVVF